MPFLVFQVDTRDSVEEATLFIGKRDPSNPAARLKCPFTNPEDRKIKDTELPHNPDYISVAMTFHGDLYKEERETSWFCEEINLIGIWESKVNRFG